MTRDLIVNQRNRVRRQTTSPSHTYEHWEHQTWYDGRKIDVEVESGIVPESETVMHDTVTSPYWEIIRRGGIINQPMSKTELVYIAAPLTCVEVYNNRPYAQWNATVLHTGHLWQVQKPEVFPAVTPPAGLASARDKAIARVFEKAAAPGFNTLINLYQLPQLVSLLKAAFRRLESLFGLIRNTGRYRNRRLRALGRHTLLSLVDLDGLWLEWRYGWRPLIMDIHDLIDVFIESMGTPPPRITYRATEKFDFAQAKENPSFYNPIGAESGVKNCFTTSTEASYEFRAGIMLSGASLTNARRYGLRKEDIPSAIWDAVPFSFVVDWFVGVTTWLTGITINRENILASWITTSAKQRTELVAVFSAGTLTSGSGASAQAYTRSLGVSTMSIHVTTKSRQVGLVPPDHPILDPRWSEFTNFLHLLDSLSLMLQQFKKLNGKNVSRR